MMLFKITVVDNDGFERYIPTERAFKKAKKKKELSKHLKGLYANKELAIFAYNNLVTKLVNIVKETQGKDKKAQEDLSNVMKYGRIVEVRRELLRINNVGYRGYAKCRYECLYQEIAAHTHEQETTALKRKRYINDIDLQEKYK